MPDISGSVGRNGDNNYDDVMTVQTLINKNLPVPLAPLEEDGLVGPHTIFAIEEFQRRRLRMNPPDGRVDPNGRTLRALNGDVQPVGPPSAPAVLPGTPATPNSSAYVEINVARPDAMRESAWRYLMKFTQKHEGYVPHMYNNRKEEGAGQDVTCGIGFRIEKRGNATDGVFVNLFYDPNTNDKPTPQQMLYDYDRAAELTRTDKPPNLTRTPATPSNVICYSDVCKLRMYKDRIYTRMAEIMKTEKLPALINGCRGRFKDFASFPAPAQVFCLSFAYGRMPTGVGKDGFPKMADWCMATEWAKAAGECHVNQQSELKYLGHVRLLQFAQQIKDMNGDYDQVPADIF
jgi:hypothetical protein